jgi:hypothetical protein
MGRLRGVRQNQQSGRCCHLRGNVVGSADSTNRSVHSSSASLCIMEMLGGRASSSNFGGSGYLQGFKSGTLTWHCTGGSVWLKQWSEVNSKFGGNPDFGKYIGIYFAFGFGSAALVVVQTLILWIFCSIEVSPCPCSSHPLFLQVRRMPRCACTRLP